MRPVRLVFASLLAAAFATTTVHAWEPEEPISILVGFSPGGGTDTIARHIASVAQPEFPVPIAVVNKPGASGSIAAETVANAEPDGYTLFIAGGSETVSLGNHQELPYDVREDFTGIMQISRQRVLVAVPADSPWQTLDDMIEDAKANPGKYKYASSGSGSTYHSLMLVLSEMADLEMKHLPYKGGAPALAALLGGHVDVAPIAPEEAQAMHDAGQIRYLGLASDERMPALPDVPTLKEQGYDIFIENVKGIAGPAGIPQERVEYLQNHFKKALESEAFQSLAEKANIEVQYRDGEAYMETMRDIYQQVGAAID